MPQAKSKSNLTRLFKQGDVILVAGLFGTVMLMILPIHPFFLDGFLAISIALSLLILLSILYVKEPAEFTGFPTLLLFKGGQLADQYVGMMDKATLKSKLTAKL